MSKSTTQRIVEVIALLLVGGVGVAFLIPVISQWQNSPATNAAVEATNPQAPPAFVDPKPKRPAVKSVAELPNTYPKVEEIVFTSSQQQIASVGKEEKRLPKVAVRHLNAYIDGNEAAISADGRWAVVSEHTPANTNRIAVWNLDSGKLLRFLPAEPGKTVAGFSGKENADFGATVDMPRFGQFLFSPQGKWLAATHVEFGSTEPTTIRVWELATGRLTAEYNDVPSDPTAVMFVDDESLLIPQPIALEEWSIVRLYAATGEADLFQPVEHRAFHAGASRGDMVALQSRSTIRILNRATGVEQEIELPKESSPFRKLAFMPDGKRLVCWDDRGTVELWDLATKSLIRSSASQSPGRVVAFAADAKVSVLADPNHRWIELMDIEQGKQLAKVNLPFRFGRFLGISSNARRHVYQTDQGTILVVDFEEGIPSGDFDLADLIANPKIAATR